MKNDDMDELFRKAAENYSVDTTRASDWERVSAALKEGGNNADAEKHQEKKKKRRGFFIWWLLLLPAGWMAHNTWHSIAGEKKNIAHRQSSTAPFTIADKETTNGKATTETALTSLPENSANSSLNKKKADGSSSDLPLSVKQDELQPENKPPLAEPKPGNKAVEKNAAGGGIAIQDKVHRTRVTNEKEATPSINDPGKLPNKNSNAIDRAGDKKEKLPFATSGTPQEDLHKNELNFNFKNDAKAIVPFMQKVGKAGATVFPAFAQQKLSFFKSGEESLSDSNVTALIKKQTPGRERGFYLQALVAADITSVKLQQVKGLGHSAGILVGYQFNKRWHVEAGALWEKKKYYTAGEHFDTSKLGYLAHYKIYTVNGYCNMITIPLSARYNLSVNERRKWFVTAGVAAYFMDKENYDIKYDYYGQDRERNYSYYDAPKSWLATIKLSAGYEQSFWKTFNFRVEPYIRIPATGVGTGKLSLQSAGVFLGVGKKF